MAYAAVVTLKLNVRNLLSNFGPCFGPPRLKLLEMAHKEFKSFQEFLDGLGGNTRMRMKASLRRITLAMLQFDEKIVSHNKDQIRSTPAAKRVRGSILSLEMESIEEHFHLIFEMMKKMKKERFDGDADSGGYKSKMVGLSEVYNELKEQVLVHQIQPGVMFLSIVGMAGIGKTALAEAVFEDFDILDWFEVRVWLNVGKNCPIEEIRRCILAQLDPDSARNLAEGEGDIRTYLEEILKGKRYLIVLDDVWDARVRGYLGRLLPHGKMGSRVVLSSRSRRVAKHAEFISEMRLLNEKESWVLLREKVFGEKYCPPEIEKLGKKIAEKCDGLPLTIITVANLLSKIPQSLWIDVATKRKHQLFIDAYDEVSKVLYPSYEDLPPQFKLCFLYMAVFPPNYKIPRSRLINMWFVEGLLDSNAESFSEDGADVCLEEFVSNSLVMVYQKRSRKSVSMSTHSTKTCGVHSSWWHLCYTEARKNNFFYVLISREDRLDKGIEHQSRLSIHNSILFAIKDVHDSVEKNSASTACSLLCLGPYQRYPVPICFSLRFLKNLDALNIRLYEFPLDVLELGGLKYFALTCDGELPSSISKLQNLQFFIFRRHHNIRSLGAPSFLPVEIWDMKEMKHLQIMGSDLPDHLFGTLLPNLSTLLDVSGHSCTKNIFGKIPNLKRLGIRIELTLGVVEPLRCFHHISQLTELETLKCDIINPAKRKFEFLSLPSSRSIFPLGLKKLTLSGLGYPWKEMSKIASLPSLEVLKLRCNAFQGPKWIVEKGGFPKLEVLIIEDIDLMQWKVDQGFHKLKSITIKHCYKLKELNWRFNVEHISQIEIVDCDPSLEYIIRKALLEEIHLSKNFSVLSSWEAEDVRT